MYFLVAITTLMTAGCGGSSETVLRQDALYWANKTGSLSQGPRGEAFYGVEASTGLSNVQLRRTASETTRVLI